METVVNIVLFPYSLAETAFATGGELWPIDTVLVWIVGTVLYTLIFLLAGSGVYAACLGIEAGAEKLRLAADLGASLEERRRNAGWLVRVSSRMRAIRARGPVTTAGLLTGDEAEPLQTSRRSNWLARRVIHCLEFLRDFRIFLPGILFTTVGGLGLIASLWVVHPETIRGVVHWVLYDFNPSTTPIAFWALLFTMTSFLVKDVVGWKRRGLTSWRTTHVSDAYDALSRIRALAYEILGLEVSSIPTWADVALRAAPREPVPELESATGSDARDDSDPFGLRAGTITHGDRMTDPDNIAEGLAGFPDIAAQIDEKLTAIRAEAETTETRGVLLRCAPRSSRPLISTLTDNHTFFRIAAFEQASITKLHELRAAGDRQAYAEKVYELLGTALLHQEDLAQAIRDIDRTLYPETWRARLLAQFNR